MNRAKEAGAALVLAAVIAASCVALYAGYWWLHRDATNREGEIKRGTFQYQQGAVAGAQDKAAEVARIDDVQLATATPDQATALGNQRTAIVTQTCQLIARVNGDIPTDLTSFKAKECS